MKKPALYFSDQSLKSLNTRLKVASLIEASSARRMLETMKYDRWMMCQLEKDNETFREFIGEVFEIVYGPDYSPQDLTQALDDIRALNETATANLKEAIN